MTPHPLLGDLIAGGIDSQTWHDARNLTRAVNYPVDAMMLGSGIGGISNRVLITVVEELLDSEQVVPVEEKWAALPGQE